MTLNAPSSRVVACTSLVRAGAHTCRGDYRRLHDYSRSAPTGGRRSLRAWPPRKKATMSLSPLPSGSAAMQTALRLAVERIHPAAHAMWWDSDRERSRPLDEALASAEPVTA